MRPCAKLLKQVDEQRNPRTGATVDELLDKWPDVVDVERKTRAGYVSKIDEHIRPELGKLPVRKVRVDTIETLYAKLRRCRDHCKGRKEIRHRTTREHLCDEHTTRRRCALGYACTVHAAQGATVRPTTASLTSRTMSTRSTPRRSPDPRRRTQTTMPPADHPPAELPIRCRSARQRARSAAGIGSAEPSTTGDIARASVTQPRATATPRA